MGLFDALRSMIQEPMSGTLGPGILPGTGIAEERLKKAQDRAAMQSNKPFVQVNDGVAHRVNGQWLETWDPKSQIMTRTQMDPDHLQAVLAKFRETKAKPKAMAPKAKAKAKQSSYGRLTEDQ